MASWGPLVEARSVASWGPLVEARSVALRGAPRQAARAVRSFDFHFDYSCPYAYLAYTGVHALAARARAEVRLSPMLLGGVFRAVGTPQRLFETLSPAKAAHNAHDMARWAERFGVPLRMPAEHPFRTVEALRATLVTGVDPRVVRGFYDAYWVENRPVSDEAVMREVLRRAGHAPEPVLAAIREEGPKDELRRLTDLAIARGVFGAPAFWVDGELYWGQDRMDFVERALGGAPRPLVETRPMAKPHTLDVYFDFASPFSYLGVSQIPALQARTGCVVRWKPFLLGGLFKLMGQEGVPMFSWSEQKRAYTLKDLHRWAEHWGVPFAWPSTFPTHSLLAMRAYLALPEDRRHDFCTRVFHAYWAEGKDLRDPALLAQLAGPDGEDVVARAQAPEVKDALKHATEEAHAKGVFGAPTFVVDDTELYWGQDRLGLVEIALGR